MSAEAVWTRETHRSLLARPDPFDVVVVGGGVTGAGAALDLAARGLEVAVVERSDFAQGTSSRSTKLFHGGIRYLPQFHLGLVSEGLREQKVLARVADFLYHPLEFVIPMYAQYGIADAPEWAARGWRAPLALRAGLMAYDVLGGWGRPGSRHRRVGSAELLAALPTLRAEGLERGFVYSDAQTDDARLVIGLLKTAVARYGAVAANRVEVESVAADSPFTVRAVDRLDGERFTLRARTVLAATGAFDPPGLSGAGIGLKMVRSKGSHLIVDSDVLQLGDRALVLPETDDGRVLYIVPWLGHSMIGTTDTPYSSDPAHPVATAEDTDYLVRHVRRYLDVEEFRPLSTFAGLRALKDTGSGSTSRASREHVIEEPVPGYIQVAGGKLTTYRKIAAEAADAVAHALGVSARSSTDSIPLLGAGADRAAVTSTLRSVGVTGTAVDATFGRNGGDALRIARLIETDPALAESLGDGRTTRADVVHAVRHEGA
ncbi:MAG: glycerol-3-phosphate dehydrogenase/oxidase, partial [Acidimicrobiia bacterium]|nr:glycerol-3-phosphate dehydrogenase/oxidase [Acidimicrobiia bacterium]